MLSRFLMIAATVFALTFSAYGQSAGTARAKVSAAKSEARSAQAKADQASKLLDINTASKSELDALPGIGAKYSQKIVDGRPYDKKDQLVSKKVLPQGVYNKIKSLIVAKQK